MIKNVLCRRVAAKKPLFFQKRDRVKRSDMLKLINTVVDWPPQRLDLSVIEVLDQLDRKGNKRLNLKRKPGIPDFKTVCRKYFKM